MRDEARQFHKEQQENDYTFCKGTVLSKSTGATVPIQAGAGL